MSRTPGHLGEIAISDESRSLPGRPSLRFLKLEARRRHAAGEFPTLHEAQLAIAREHGQSSWTVLKELTADISRLFRSEIALLKLEIKDTVVKLGSGSALFAAAVFVALCGLAFLFVTVVLALVAAGLPAWASTLIVGVALIIAAAVLAVVGTRKFASVEFVPNKSVENIRTDIESIKSDISRVRSR